MAGQWAAVALIAVLGNDTTVAQVIAAFWKHAQAYYRHPDEPPPPVKLPHTMVFSSHCVVSTAQPRLYSLALGGQGPAPGQRGGSPEPGGVAGGRHQPDVRGDLYHNLRGQQTTHTDAEGNFTVSVRDRTVVT